MCEAQQNTINEQTKELNTLQTTITDLQKLVKDRDLEIKRFVRLILYLKYLESILCHNTNRYILTFVFEFTGH